MNNLIYGTIRHIYNEVMSNLALNDALNLFTGSLSKKGRSINTIVAYKGDINQLINFLGKKQVITIELLS